MYLTEKRRRVPILPAHYAAPENYVQSNKRMQRVYPGKFSVDSIKKIIKNNTV